MAEIVENKLSEFSTEELFVEAVSRLAAPRRKSTAEIIMKLVDDDLITRSFLKNIATMLKEKDPMFHSELQQAARLRAVRANHDLRREKKILSTI